MIGYGFSHLFPKSVNPYDPSAQAYFSTVPDPFNTTDKEYINDLILELKNIANGWSQIDRLWLLANSTEGNSLICIKSLQSATKVNTPIFTAYRGSASDGAGYWDLNFNPSSSGTNYTLNSASAFVYMRTGTADTGTELGVNDATNHIRLINKWSIPNILATINGTAATQIAYDDGDYTGFIGIKRTAANAVAIWKDGTEVATGAGASSALPNLNMYGLGWNNNGTAQVSVDQNALIMLGSGSLDVAAVNTAINNYMTNIGANV